MENYNVAPINHNFGTATVTTAAEAGKGGLRGLGTGSLWVGALSAIGFTAAVVAGVGALGLIAIGTLGFGATLFSGGIGSVFGAAKGAYHGFNRVSQEQGAANVVQTQLAVYQAQAQAQAIAAANDNKFNFPAQGSQFNPAGTTVNVVQADGRLDGQQLQRA